MKKLVGSYTKQDFTKDGVYYEEYHKKHLELMLEAINTDFIKHLLDSHQFYIEFGNPNGTEIAKFMSIEFTKIIGKISDIWIEDECLYVEMEWKKDFKIYKQCEEFIDEINLFVAYLHNGEKIEICKIYADTTKRDISNVIDFMEARKPIMAVESKDE